MSKFNPANLFLERLTEGDQKRKLFFAKQTNVVGRDMHCDIVLLSTIISRRHCEIEFRNSKMYIKNFKNSANGTYVNDSKIIQETELEEGDNVGFGCNPETLEKNRMKDDWFIYKVKRKNIETIELVSSDEEGQNDEIDELCDDFKENAEEMIEKLGEDELVVELSSDEETDADKTWKEKLSQGNSSRSPIRYRPDSVESMEVQEEPAFDTQKKQAIDESFGQLKLEEHVSDGLAEEMSESPKHEDTSASDESILQLNQVCDSLCGVALESRTDKDLAEGSADLEDAADFEGIVEDFVELEKVHLPSKGHAEIEETDQETMQESLTAVQDPFESNGHDQEEEIDENPSQPSLPIGEIVENFPLPIDESYALPPSPPTSDEPVRRLLPALAFSINIERLPIDVMEDSLDSTIASDGESLRLSEATRCLSETEVDPGYIPITSLYGKKRAPMNSPHAVPSKKARRKRKTSLTVNSDSMSAEASPSPSKVARKSISKKMPSPMSFSDEAFEDGPEGDPGSSLNASCNASPKIPKSRKESRLKKNQSQTAKSLKKKDESTVEQSAAGNSIQSPVSGYKERDEARRIPKLLLRRQSTTEFTVERVPTDDSFELQNITERALESQSPEGPGGKRAKTQIEKKRRNTVCIGDEDEVSPAKKQKFSKGPIIIEAQHLRKRESPGNPSTSATSPSCKSSEDMFAKAAKMRGFMQRRKSVDSVLSPKERELKDKSAGERKEKLRLLQEDHDRKRKAEEEEKARTDELKEKPKTAPLKVKYTEKNRGDFLVNPLQKPPLPPRRQSITNSPKSPMTSNESKFSKDVLLQKLKEFKKQNLKVTETAAIANEGSATCNNLAFYKSLAEFDTNDHSEPTPTAGFYNPIESPEPPSVVYQTNEKLRSILKKNPSTRPKLKIRFDEDENGKVIEHIREIPNIQNDRLPLNPLEPLSESVKKKLTVEQYLSQQRIILPAKCQPSTSSIPSCESRPTQHNGLKVNLANLHEYHSVPSPVTSNSHSSPTQVESSSHENLPDFLISNEERVINQILMWRTEWLQTLNPQTSVARTEQELLFKVASKYQQVYKKANDFWDILTVKEVSRLNSKLCEITFISSTDMMPRNYEIGSLLFLKTYDSESLGYISRTWRGAGEARYLTVQTSFDFAKLQVVVKIQSRHVFELQSELESIRARKQMN